MKFLRNIVDKVKPNFEKGGKLEKFYPAFEALETFLFTPGHTTSHGVHVRDAIDLKRTMVTVIIALIPPLLFGMWNTGYQHFLAYGMEMSHVDCFLFGLQKVLPIIIVSYAAGLGVEFIFAVIRRHPVSEGYLVTGLLIPLTLPVTIPLWMVALAAIFCTVLGKEIFGGTGMNFMNPALLARVFLFFAFPAYMSGEIWTDLSPETGQAIVDAYSGATNLVTFDSNFNEMQSGWMMFAGLEQGSIGETSVIACLLGAFILLWTGVGSWKIMFSAFAGAWIMGVVLNWLAPADLPLHAMHTPSSLSLVDGWICIRYCVHGDGSCERRANRNRKMDLRINYRHAHRPPPGIQSGLPGKHHADHPADECFFSADRPHGRGASHQKKIESCVAIDTYSFTPSGYPWSLP